MAAVAQLEGGDVVAHGVRDAAGVAKALAEIEERELGARVRTLASTQQPGALRPGGQIEQIGELDHPRTLANSPVFLDRRCPVLLLGEEQCSSHLDVHGMADREVAVRLCEARHEAVRRAGGVRAHEDRVYDLFEGVTGLVAEPVLRWERGDRLVQELEVVVRIVRPGVARAQHRGERLGGGVAPHAEGMEAEAALVGGSSVLFVRVCGEQRRVEVQGERVSRWGRRPDPLPRGGDRLRDLAQLERARRLQRSPRGRDRGDRTEELLLLAQRREIREAVRPVGDRDGEVGEHDARVMGVPGDPALTHCHRHRPGETGAIGKLGEQRRARVGDEVPPVRGYFRSTDRAITVHLQGALRSW